MTKDIFSSKLGKTTSYDISLESLCKAHLMALAPRLRRADQAELYACYRLPALQGLNWCLQRSSEAYALLINKQVCAVAGVAPDNLLGSRACVWLFTSKEIMRYPRIFYQISRQMLQHFTQLYPHLYSWCDERYQAAQRYLQHLGAYASDKKIQLAGKETKFQLYLF